ncbi:hypothetical protein AOLI_G00010300 [Acnodon oligacanthus]
MKSCSTQKQRGQKEVVTLAEQRKKEEDEEKERKRKENESGKMKRHDGWNGAACYTRNDKQIISNQYHKPYSRFRAHCMSLESGLCLRWTTAKLMKEEGLKSLSLKSTKALYPCRVELS